MGAEVIKIEPPSGRSTGSARSSRQALPEARPWNIQGTLNKLNRNKKSLVLDLTKPEGRTIFLKLAAVSDVVMENFRASVTKKLGIDFADLVQINPTIVFVSLPGFGRQGPYSEYPAYGPAI